MRRAKGRQGSLLVGDRYQYRRHLITYNTATKSNSNQTGRPVTRSLSEDNGWPNVEGRVALGIGAPQGTGLLARRPLELGISGVVGQLRTVPVIAPDVIANVWGVSGDFLNSCLKPSYFTNLPNLFW